MADNDDTGFSNDPAFRRLRALRARISTGYSLTVLGLFALFVAASSLYRGEMSEPLFEGAPFSLALVAAFLMIVLPIALAAAFLRKSDRDIEPLRAEIAERRKAAEPDGRKQDTLQQGTGEQGTGKQGTGGQDK